MTGGGDRDWWRSAVIYQVYPRSFQDSDGDGVGDLRGITARLDHLEWLGVDGLWLSPIFPSPMADFGYDISDYTGVAPVFGTLADLDALVASAHARGIRVLLDFVPNHTSDAHPWFVASRSSRDDPKRDWYLWADPQPDGSPPNAWESMFGGPAWTLDQATGQFYYHSFLAEQPELNWRNPRVVQAMLGVLRFWLDRGIDGFRIDVLWLLLKDADWAAAYDPAHPWAGRSDLPGMAEIDRRLRETVDEYADRDGSDRVLVGEIYLPIDRLVAYYGTPEAPGVHLPFNFQLITLPWDAARIAEAIDAYETALPSWAWPNWVLGNHDQQRIATRVGAAQARVAAMLLLTLRGTPTLYYGDEIGMRDVDVPPERRVDPAEPPRDPARSPMQWDASPAGGFTTGAPWLPTLHDPVVSVEGQRDVPGSMLELHRALLALRRAKPALATGDFERLDGPPATLVYRRRAVLDAGAEVDIDARRAVIVALNLGSAPVRVDIDVEDGAVVLLDTGLRREGEPVSGSVDLAANEGLILG